jgi:hypothetical protein
MVKGSPPWESGQMAFFSEMCRKYNHRRAVCLYCQPRQLIGDLSCVP